jgi:MarR family transcriptional regulator, organic hydroperoxide resistance regulator
MLDRKSQIEGLIQKFHSLRHKMLTGTFILSPENQIPNSQWIVLHNVYHNEGIGVKNLSRMLGISSSATTQLVDSLVKRGHLIREVNLEDRRALKIRLSKKTKDLICFGRNRAFGKVYSLFDILTDEEFQLYCDLTKKVVDNILEQGDLDLH